MRHTFHLHACIEINQLGSRVSSECRAPDRNRPRALQTYVLKVEDSTKLNLIKSFDSSIGAYGDGSLKRDEYDCLKGSRKPVVGIRVKLRICTRIPFDSLT